MRRGGSDNTGGVTQAFGSLHRAITSRLGQGELPEAEVLLEKIELVGAEKWANSFGLPEIMMMKELTERAPQLFRRTIVACDLVNDSAEDVLETLTSCFAGGAGGVPELGLGNAEQNVVIVAWKRYLSLFVNARRFSRWSVVLQYVLLILALLTTISSVLFSLFESQGAVERAVAAAKNSEEGEEHWTTEATTILQSAVIVLPLVSALGTTIKSRLRSNDKYARCLVAASEISSEIYKFRCRTLDYDLSRSAEKDENGEDKKAESSKTAEQLKRDLFAERVQNIYANAMTGEVQSGGALRADGVLTANIENPRERAAFLDKLREHLAKHTFGQRRKDRQKILEDFFKQKPDAAKRAGVRSDPDAQRSLVGARSVEPDDLATSLSIETYVEYRVRPYVSHLEKVAPQLARKLQVLEILVFLANSAGAILALIVVGTISLANFVAVSVAIASTLSSIIEFHNLQARVTATNGALREMHNLLVWWAALSMVDRRTSYTKHRVVSTLERCMLLTVAAEAAAVVSSDSADGAGGENSGQ